MKTGLLKQSKLVSHVRWHMCARAIDRHERWRYRPSMWWCYSQLNWFMTYVENWFSKQCDKLVYTCFFVL